MNPVDSKEVAAALSAPFDPKDIKFKPQMVKGNRALAMAYITSRAVMDRLDEVMGAENWQDSYELLPGGSVVCTLSVSLGGQWVSKVDVGNPSEQPDDGDKLKAAFSDALKRAAVKWGIGRYLYRLPAQWCDYDPVKKQFTALPQLPAFALPRGEVSSRAPAPAARPAFGTPPFVTHLLERVRAAADRDAALALWGEYERVADGMAECDREAVKKAFADLKGRFTATA